eukprot:tig00000325_g24087.t1
MAGISIEGNIGAGKSTFLRFLAERCPIPIESVPEPIEAWTDLNGQNLLELFYKDPSRWAYSFQMFAFYSRVKQVSNLEEERMLMRASGADLRATSLPIRIHERCIYSDRYIFATNARASGLFVPAEWALYADQFDFMHARFPPRIYGFVYLWTRPEVAYARLCARNRREESTVPLSYLQSLHERHERWLNHRDAVIPPTDENRSPNVPLTPAPSPAPASAHPSPVARAVASSGRPSSLHSELPNPVPVSILPGDNGTHPLVWHAEAEAAGRKLPVLVLNGNVDYQKDPQVSGLYTRSIAEFAESVRKHAAEADEAEAAAEAAGAAPPGPFL